MWEWLVDTKADEGPLEDQTNELPDVVTKTLENDLILTRILFFMSRDELLRTCCLVNSFWRSLATSNTIWKRVCIGNARTYITRPHT